MEEYLTSLGLNEKQRAVYVACLQLGVAKARAIAIKVGLERQAVYYVLQLLEKQGLISELIKSGVKHYAVVDPQTVMEQIQETYVRKKEAIEKLSQEMEKLNNIHLRRPRVEQYEGDEGFKTAVRDLLSESDSEVYGYSCDKIMFYSHVFLKSFLAKRKDKNIHMKAIVEDSDYIREGVSSADNDLRVMKISNHLMGNKDFTFAIAEDKMIFARANSKDQYGFKIEDKEFCEFQRKLFDLVWKQLPKLH